jgi:hypothetical protein
MRIGRPPMNTNQYEDGNAVAGIDGRGNVANAG